MPRRSFKKKRAKRSKKRSKSVRRQIMDIMCPPQRSMQVLTNSLTCVENSKNYLDLAYWPSELNYGFMTQAHMASIITNVGRFNAPYSADQQWYFRKCKRSYEFTNISNTVIYLTLNEFIPKSDVTVLHTIPYLSTSSFVGYLNGLLSDVAMFPDEATAATDMLGTSFLSGNSGGYASNMVYENVLANPLVKDCLKGTWKMKIGKEVALRPQQTMLFSQSGVPGYLFCAQNHRVGSASGSYATDYKGVTKRLVLTMTGQTARATATGTPPTYASSTYVNSALGVLHITCRDEATVQSRTENSPVYEVAVANGAGYLAAGRAFEFGDENNAPVANV